MRVLLFLAFLENVEKMCIIYTNVCEDTKINMFQLNIFMSALYLMFSPNIAVHLFNQKIVNYFSSHGNDGNVDYSVLSNGMVFR